MKGGQGCFICGGDHFARECPENDGDRTRPRRGKGATKGATKGGGKGKGKGKGDGNRGGKGRRVGQILDPSQLSPPVDDAGEWVFREDFQGNKSFGYFQCDCGKDWQSAHAYKEFVQDCKSCESGSWPLFMWKNFHRRAAGYDEKESDRTEKGEHDVERCGACQAGVCTFRNGPQFG